MKYQSCLLLISLFFVINSNIKAQSNYWQQGADYYIEINFDVKKHQFTGIQRLTYYNNSPDTLTKVFYHLYFNAFQPNSMMDVRSRNIDDPDGRVKDRIFYLKEDEIGYLKVNELYQNSQKVSYEVVGTVVEVTLVEAILPNTSATFDMNFDGQVPVQIRRSGRNNKEGVAYSMSQWYPKMAEYDEDGWHPDPYVGREFYGIWGDFEVKITIDKDYLLGGTGYIQNPQEVGFGYEDPSRPTVKPKKTITWHFKAPKVHDFMWAADPDYVHDKVQVPDGPELHFIYQPDSIQENWRKLQPYMVEFFQEMSNTFGKYPYKQYSFIQGGDGGMEYPMATLITGGRNMESLVGVSIHEAVHSWYQMVLATNEAKYSWMDEGFTTYAQDYITDIMFDMNQDNPQFQNYYAYAYLVESGLEEPMSTHSDHYSTNTAYGLASYSKGAVFLHQLNYIIGSDNFFKGMKNYYNQWKFKHPDDWDFLRVMEKQSDLVLDWYLEYWVYSTKTIDYAIDKVESKENKTNITLKRIGEIPMPLDLRVSLKDGSEIDYYIPLQIMRGEKPQEFDLERILKEDWAWTHPEYILEIEQPMENIEKIEIDPTGRLADIQKENNIFPADK